MCFRAEINEKMRRKNSRRSTSMVRFGTSQGGRSVAKCPGRGLTVADHCVDGPMISRDMEVLGNKVQAAAALFVRLVGSDFVRRHVD